MHKLALLGKEPDGDASVKVIDTAATGASVDGGVSIRALFWFHMRNRATVSCNNGPQMYLNTYISHAGLLTSLLSCKGFRTSHVAFSLNLVPKTAHATSPLASQNP